MKFRPPLFAVYALFALIASGCAAATTARVGDSPGLVRKNLGLASAYDFADIGKGTFQRYQYVVQREDPAPQLLLESMWRDRQAFSDEGTGDQLTQARSRMILSGRPSARSTSGAGELFDVTIAVESEVRVLGEEWSPAAMTPLLTAYVEDMIAYIEGRFRGGTRRFGTPPRAPYP